MSQLYDNVEGFSTEANRIANLVRNFLVSMMEDEDYAEHNLLALAGLFHGAVEEARLEVSMRRRMPLQDPSEIIRRKAE